MISYRYKICFTNHTYKKKKPNKEGGCWKWAFKRSYLSIDATSNWAEQNELGCQILQNEKRVPFLLFISIFIPHLHLFIVEYHHEYSITKLNTGISLWTEKKVKKLISWENFSSALIHYFFNILLVFLMCRHLCWSLIRTYSRSREQTIKQQNRYFFYKESSFNITVHAVVCLLFGLLVQYKNKKCAIDTHLSEISTISHYLLAGLLLQIDQNGPLTRIACACIFSIHFSFFFIVYQTSLHIFLVKLNNICTYRVKMKWDIFLKCQKTRWHFCFQMKNCHLMKFFIQKICFYHQIKRIV